MPSLAKKERRLVSTDDLSTRRRFWSACALTCLATLGLVAITLLPDAPALGDAARFTLVCGMTILMAVGATFAVFSLRRP